MIVGIDLGTTNSLIAYYDGEKPVIIPNRLGKNLTPSVVSMDENNQIYVGELAKERQLLYPDSCASVFKRSMGTNKMFRLNKDHEFTASELSSFVLRALKEDAEAYLGEPIEEAIISVPAYFNDARRKATKLAGELAGFKVERIISEPTAAAIAYGLYGNKENAKFLVFDLGGGTFDVSILEKFENILEVSAVCGDNYLGGEDFTNVIEEMFFEKNPTIEKEKLSAKELRQIHKIAENAKLNFNDLNEIVMKVSLEEKEYELTMTANEYEEKLDILFDKIREPVKKSLADSGLKLGDLDKVVLIGGATKLSIVRKFAGKMFRIIPDTSINPDEAVALGAALQGAMKERTDGLKEVILTDVCPFTLGTEVSKEIDEGKFEGGFYAPIIERNTVIPASRSDKFYTIHDNQTKVTFNIYQGESRYVKNNVLLGTLEVELPKNLAGKEGAEVTFTYDVNSILEVMVRILSTGKEYKKYIKNNDNDMTYEEMVKRFEELSYLKIHPRDEEENRLLLTRGERLYEESLRDDRRKIENELKRFEIALETRDKAKISEAKGRLKEFLDSFGD